MRDKIELGSVPFNEEEIQVNPLGDYHQAMMTQCTRYKNLLQDTFPACIFPDVHFCIIWNKSEFGLYAEVVVIFDNANEESMTQAYYIEDHLPDNWAESDSDN